MNKEEIRSKVIELLNKKILACKVLEIKDDDAIGEDGIGLDSLNFLKFLTEIEKEFNIIIEDDYWYYGVLSTFNDLYNYIMLQLGDEVLL